MRLLRLSASRLASRLPVLATRSMAALLLATTPLLSPLANVAHAAPCDPPITNPIVCENTKPGNPSSEWDIAGSGDSNVQGFATDISYNRGQTVRFKISTPATAYSITIYRMGYYQGNGARKITTISPSAALPQTQPACFADTAVGLVDCGNWAESASWTIPTDAVSGIYFARLARTDGTAGSSHIVFVVRDDASTSDILFQTDDPTWQAYNQYGGNSTYQSVSLPQGRAYKVSYNRPFATRGQASGYGTANWVFYAEYPMVRWLEANGYNTSYFSGLDADRLGGLIKNHKIFLSVGHDEYWSAGQRANVEAARDAGVNLAFFSGNAIFWKTRWENSFAGPSTANRTLVVYKETKEAAPIDPLDPPVWTGTWRDPTWSPPADGGRPENNLMGTIFQVNRGSGAIQVPVQYNKLRLWRNTSVASATTTQTLGTDTIGYEWDTDVDNGFRPAGTIRLSQTTLSVPELIQDYGNTFSPGTATHYMTQYRAPSGALVFSAGTVQWAWGLDTHHDTSPDTGPASVVPAMQQATLNILADMGVQPATRDPALVAANKSTDTTAPSASVSSPANGANLAVNAAATISGTASDTGGLVGGVEVTTDGGATWHPVTSGTTTWSYTWTPKSGGPAVIKARATDDTGNIGAASAGITVNVTGDTTAPVISNVTTSNITATQAIVTWKTSEPATSQVKFGPTTTYGSQTTLDTTLVTDHTVTVAGLAEKSTYHFQVSSKDAVNNAASSADGTFTTPANGTIALVGSQAVASAVDTNGAGVAEAFQYLASTTGTANVLYLYLDAANTAPSVTVGLYSNNSNNDPGTLLSKATIASPVNGAWNSVTIPNTPIQAGAKYWIAILSPAGASAVFIRDTANGSRTQTSSQANLTTLPATWSVGTGWSNSPMSAYAAQVGGSIDTTPPTVGVTAPADGATVSGSTVTLSASATDDVSVANVQFLLDGSPLGSPDASPPYTLSWDSTAVSNGSHSIGARATDGAGNIGNATELQVSVSNVSAPPVISAVQATGLTSSGATITWTTDKGSTSQVRYGQTTNYGSTTTLDPTLVTSHSQTLSGLAASTTYHYQVVSTDANNTSALSADAAFTTAADTTPPALSGIQASELSSTGAAITWTTDEASDSQVEYGTTSTYGSATTLDSSMATSHSVALGGLSPGTQYHYRVKSKDAAGNLATSTDQTFSTMAACPCSIWPLTATPATPAAADGGALEVGVKFRVAAAGYIFGIRYYKGATNTGTHVGNVWSSTGSLLASATFSNESAVGWQQVQFATPVPVQANTTYVASYHTNSGNYAADANFFAAGGAGTAPVQALGTGVDGPNGVFTYSAASAFPNQSFNATNYWVDVVYSTNANETIPPFVTNVQASVTPTGATITWGTNKPADSQVEYGTTAAYGSSTPLDATQVVNHSVVLTGLTQATTYHYRVKSKDATGASTVTGDLTFTTSTPPTCPCSAWSGTAAPSSTGTANDGQPIEVGVKFRSDTAGYINGVRFYKTAGNTGTHIGHLWTSTGSLLATVVFSGESASGWQQGLFGTPVQIQPNTTYVASYYSTSGNYVADGGGLANGVNNGYLHLLASGVDGPNGLYNYGASTIPTQSFNASNYWVDVVFNTVRVDTVAPSLVSQTPAPNATRASTATAVAAGFSEPIDEASLAFTLSGPNPGTASVSASVTYDATTRTARLQPTQALSGNASYTAKVSASDAAGNAMAPVSWSFTTQNCPCTIWPSTATPANPSANDGQPIELGVKFRSDVSGYISGIRFFKGASNTGTHVGSLWTSTGSPLAAATFTGETASGWQQVLFATPVQIQANTTYVASYHTDAGSYAADTNALATSGVDGGSLHALGNGVDGPNGVFTYSAASAFPTQSFNASNYWVDVVFNTTAVDSVAPTIAAVQAGNVSATGATITWTTNEAADTQVEYGPTTAYGSSTPIVTALVTSHSATLSGLGSGTLYHYRVKSRDAAGNLATSADQTFTSASACPCSIWSTAATPATAAANDNGAVELGVKFRADRAGSLAGIRFYKAATNTGTHVVSLWSSTGTLLGTATAGSETASGWQTVTFSTPVQIQADTTYVASYHTNTGNYSVTGGAFANAGVDTAPLHALASGVDGPNGLFVYSATSAFPTQSFNATNYWVDVIFQ